MDESPHFIDQVFERLLEAIALGELKPGQRIRQSALASQLNISRQPVSHALQLLKHEGLVRDAGRQGVEVTPIDAEYMRQLYQARKVLEVAAAAMAAQRVADRRVTPSEVDDFKRALEEGCLAFSDGRSHADLVRADYKFHRALYRLADNAVIDQMMAGRWVHLMRSMLIVLDVPLSGERAWGEHREIASRVLAGNVLEAGELMTRHLQQAATDMYGSLTASAQSLTNSEAA